MQHLTCSFIFEAELWILTCFFFKPMASSTFSWIFHLYIQRLPPPIWLPQKPTPNQVWFHTIYGQFWSFTQRRSSLQMINGTIDEQIYISFQKGSLFMSFWGKRPRHNWETKPQHHCRPSNRPKFVQSWGHLYLEGWVL
jgi:hypothetical protein